MKTENIHPKDLRKSKAFINDVHANLTQIFDKYSAKPFENIVGRVFINLLNEGENGIRQEIKDSAAIAAKLLVVVREGLRQCSEDAIIKNNAQHIEEMAMILVWFFTSFFMDQSVEDLQLYATTYTGHLGEEMTEEMLRDFNLNIDNYKIEEA
jgi:hypothetical protein